MKAPWAGAILMVVAAMVVAGCHADPAPPLGGGVGEMKLALTATAGSTTFVLANAIFVVERVQPPPSPGEIAVVRLQSGDPTAGNLTASLAVGRYTVTLLEGWQLERVDSAIGLVPVDGRLLSLNPVSASILSDRTTAVSFQFQSTGTAVTFGPGTIDIGIAVSICDPATDPQMCGGCGGNCAGRLANPGFEDGLAGWTKTGTAFDNQPTFGENVNASRINRITVGGDYWRDLAFPIGVRGNYWIGSKEDRPTPEVPRGQVQGDGPTGTLTSVPFRIPADTQFITFLISGGDKPGALTIELLASNAGDHLPVAGVLGKTGHNSDIFRRDWWSVGTLDRTQAYVIVITDNVSTDWGHINIDDIRFQVGDPTSTTATEGRPLLLRTAIDGRPVWTDYDAKLWGATDLHTHLMSHLSMGGKLMHGAPDVGSPAPPGTIKQGNGCNATEIATTRPEEALPDCSATHGGWGLDNTCGDDIRAAAINIGYDTKFERKIPPPTEATCRSGMVMDAGLCWEPCREGFHSASGAICTRDCPAGFADSPLNCTGTIRDRGVGYFAQGVDRQLCEQDHPQGCEQGLGGIWYPKCDPGFQGIGPACLRSCPAGFSDGGISCFKPDALSRPGYSGTFDDYGRCERDFPGQCEGCGPYSVPRCPSGYSSSAPLACLFCFADCPAGMTDIGVACMKNEYDRGNGYLGHTDDRAACEHDHPEGCEQCAGPFFPKCPSGTHNLLCNSCVPNCPAHTTDVGLTCAKDPTDNYLRPLGTPPVFNVHGDHEHAGWPTMKFWPHWSTKAHQQMYVDWIKRAHDGGLNVLVALAVNNELLGEVMNGSLAKDDKASADKQVTEIRNFISRHGDFMMEAGSAVELRRAVKQGKLAVVVGVEVDDIGNFNVNNPFLTVGADAVKAEIRRLYGQGVRYIFPVHVADNVFGGSAVYEPLFNFSNRFARTRPLPTGLPFPPGFLYQVETSSDPLINFRLQILPGGQATEWASNLTLVTAKTIVDTLSVTPYPPAFDLIKCPVPVLGCVPQFRVLSSLLSPDPQWDEYQLVAGGQVNQRSLSAMGEVAIKEMMRLGMIIDIDHMSDKTANRALEIADLLDYPVNSGHTGFRFKPGQEIVNENMRTREQLTRLGKGGGMMGVGWAGADAPTYLDNYRFGLQHGGVETCVVEPVGRVNRTICTLATPPAFTLGSDINGFAPMPRARNSHVDYCTSDAECQANPSKVRLYTFGTTADGQPRTWNYNNPPGADAKHTGEGVAHIGLYPDFFQDLKDLGMTEGERSSFFSAAEALARMWDKIETRKSTVP